MAYEDLQGSPMRVEDHSAYSKPDASQHYAGEVLPLQIEKVRNFDYMHAGPAARSREDMQMKLKNNPATDNVTILPGLENILHK
jgi:hypothetical protein